MHMQIRRFQDNLLNWFDHSGRKDLPWQQAKSGYSVWVSEIMLQQTQVNTVIPYFQRFMERFPTLKSLAAASQEDVLHLWTGLGYYARGRNLHKAAQAVQTEFQGQFPTSMEHLISLPGIGRSTAAAVLSLAYHQHHAILDGNVKRILSRFFRLDGWPGDPAVIKQLWVLADRVTPKARCAAFNQAMMDLGASLCSRSKPQCQLCPISGDCKAFLSGQTAQYPTARPKKSMPERAYYFLMLINPNQAVLLEKRPSSGIWGGLWVFPQFLDLDEMDVWLKQHQIEMIDPAQFWQPFRHTFTHFHLQVKPVKIAVKQLPVNFKHEQYCWYRHDDDQDLGLPTPVLKLLQLLGLVLGTTE